MASLKDIIPGARIGKLTVTSVGKTTAHCVCDCGAKVVRHRVSLRDAEHKTATPSCSECLRKIRRERYPAPAVSLVGAFNGLERLLR